MNKFVVAGKESSFGYYIEGDKSKVTASLYISKETTKTQDFINKHSALKWIQNEVQKLLGDDYD